MWIRLITESTMPSDEQSIRNAFHHDFSDEKMVPTEEFMETAFNVLNQDLFGDELKSKLTFLTESKPSGTFVGLASYQISGWSRVLTPTKITLNRSRKMTLHDWLEVMVHEMVHIYDYENYPHRYTKMKHYDAHGDWFLDFGKKFLEYGFHVQKKCTSPFEMDMDNSRIANRAKDTVFIELEGYHGNKPGARCVVCTSRKSLDRTIELFTQMKANKRIPNLTTIWVWSSENPKVSELKKVRLRDAHSQFSYWYFDDEFINKYGPFKEERKEDIWVLKEEEGRNSMVNEDKDEEEYDTYEHIDDDYAKHIYDTIDGVVDVKKIDDDEYEVSIE